MALNSGCARCAKGPRYDNGWGSNAPHNHPIPKRPPKPLAGEGRKVYTLTPAGAARIRKVFLNPAWQGMVHETTLEDGRIRLEVTP